MSGHSKWKNIAHKKEASDAKRAKIFTKIGREMAVCIREGGPDPVSNSRLRDIIAKARAKHGFCRGPVARIGQSDGQVARHLFCAFFRVARCCPSSWAMARKAACASG